MTTENEPCPSTEIKPCPVNHKHVIALSGAVVLQLIHAATGVRIIGGLAIFAGAGAGLYEIVALAPWIESYLAKGRIPIKDTNWAYWTSAALFLTMAVLFARTIWR